MLRQLAQFGDVYVNDAFGSAHRAHASTEGVTKYFDICAAGLFNEKRIGLSWEVQSQIRKDHLLLF